MPAQPGARARNTIRGAILAGTAVLLLAPSPAWAQRQELTDDLSGFTQTGFGDGLAGLATAARLTLAGAAGGGGGALPPQLAGARHPAWEHDR